MTQHDRRLAFLFAALTVALPSPVFPLEWSDVAAKVRAAYTSANARLADEAAQAQVRVLAYPGSPIVSVVPGAKAITAVNHGTFGQEIDLTATLTARLPLGLSETQQEKLAFARDSTYLSGLNAEAAAAEAYVDLYSSYQAAWLAQEEQKILQEELTAAARNYENTDELFKAGLATLTALKGADDVLNEAQAAALRGEARQSLAWLDLAFAAGLPETPDELGELAPYEADLPPLATLTAWATAKHAEVVGAQTSVRQIETTLARLAKGNLAVDVKASFTADRYAASLAYDSANPGVTGSFTFPAYIYGSSPEPASRTEVDTWSLGLSVGISYTGEGSDRLASDAAKAELRRQQLALQNAVHQVQLNLYGKYTLWEKASDAVEAAQRARVRISDSLGTVEAKRAIGQAGEYEVMEAEARVARAEWNLTSALIDKEKARLAAAAAAFYLGELSEVKHALEGNVR